MLSITSSAASVVGDIREQQEVPEGFALRVFPQDTPEGTQITLAFSPSPNDDDLVTETDGTKVYVAPDLAETLSDAIIDTQATPQGESLIIRKAEPA